MSLSVSHLPQWWSKHHFCWWEDWLWSIYYGRLINVVTRALWSSTNDLFTYFTVDSKMYAKVLLTKNLCSDDDIMLPKVTEQGKQCFCELQVHAVSCNTHLYTHRTQKKFYFYSFCRIRMCFSGNSLNSSWLLWGAGTGIISILIYMPHVFTSCCYVGVSVSELLTSLVNEGICMHLCTYFCRYIVLLARLRLKRNWVWSTCNYLCPLNAVIM